MNFFRCFTTFGAFGWLVAGLLHVAREPIGSSGRFWWMLSVIGACSYLALRIERERGSL